MLDVCRGWGVPAAVSRGWELGGAGTTELAEAVLRAMGSGAPTAPSFVYPDEWPLVRKIEAVASKLYGAEGVRLRTAGNNVIRYRMPTALERAGDFSQTTDNNGASIPTSRIRCSPAPARRRIRRLFRATAEWSAASRRAVSTSRA